MLRFVAAACGFGLAAVAVAVSVKAAIPVSTIQRWQEAAQDVVGISVLSIDQVVSTRAYADLRPDGSVTTFNITLKAKIDVVYRSTSGLSPNTTIIVQYGARRYKPVSPPDGNYGVILDIGQKAKVYLKKKADSSFELACDIGCLETL
ncbi:MAG: hypothetical protein HY242_10480 [Afipia sp.]|nr:hypothetical protein [Afipia sp.]